MSNENVEVVETDTTLSVGQRKYRMVALDMDGTLLGPDHRLSERSIDYLRELSSKGLIIVIATGRMSMCVFEHVSQLNLPSGIPVICLNGAYGLHVTSLLPNDDLACHDSKRLRSDDCKYIVTSNDCCTHFYKKDWRVSIKDLFYITVPMDIVKKVLTAAKERSLMVQYYIRRDVFANPSQPIHFKRARRYSEATGFQQIYCDDFSSAMKAGPPSKLMIWRYNYDIEDVFEYIKNTVGDEAHVINGTPYSFVEVTNKCVSKGNGLKKMSEIMNVPLEEIISFGDGDNDMEFIKLAGRGIAMKNATDNVKAVADEVCQWTNAEGGVIRTLKNIEKDGDLKFHSSI